MWEVIWAARHISSEHFVLFIALALVEAYREIIRDNNMDFTDIIKFFNGRRHSAVPAAAAVLLSWGFHSWPGQGKGCLRNTGPAHRGMSGVLMEIQPGGRTPGSSHTAAPTHPAGAQATTALLTLQNPSEATGSCPGSGRQWQWGCPQVFGRGVE